MSSYSLNVLKVKFSSVRNLKMGLNLITVMAHMVMSTLYTTIVTLLLMLFA